MDKSIVFVSLISFLLIHSSICLQNPLSGLSNVHEVICNEVSLNFIKVAYQEKGGDDRRHLSSTAHAHSYSCVLDPKFSSSGKTKGLRLELENTGPTFEVERQEALKNDMTRLVVRGGIIKGSTLILPDRQSSDDIQEEVLVSDEEGVPSIKSTIYQPNAIEWQMHPPNGIQRRHLRKLAVNQLGTKKVLIFRVTGTLNGNSTKTPTTDAATVSDAVFGTNADVVNLRSQYRACSYEKVDMAPASGPELTEYLVAPGVIDISVDFDGDRWFTEDLTNAVQEKAQESKESGGLGLELEDYDHVSFMKANAFSF